MLLTTLCVFVLLEVLWTVFGFYMAMRAAWKLKRLTRTAIALGILPLAVGIAADVLFNVIASLLFLQWMPTWTFSQRIQNLASSRLRAVFYSKS